MADVDEEDEEEEEDNEADGEQDSWFYFVCILYLVYIRVALECDM